MYTINTPIPITIQPLFFVVALWIGYLITENVAAMVIVGGIIFISILFHEFGHALTGIVFKQTPRITLQAFGGVTERRGPPLKKWQEFLIVLNGPLAGLLLSFIFFQLNRIYPSPFLNIGFQINLVWTIFNLIPVLPMDGGHLLRITMEKLFGFKGLKATMLISLVLAGSLTLLAFVTGEFFVGIILALFAFESWRGYSHLKTMSESDTDSDIQSAYESAENDYLSHNYTKARAGYEWVREKSPSGALYNYSTYRLAEIEARDHNYARAYNLLKPIRDSLDAPGLALLQRLAFETEDYPAVLAHESTSADQMALSVLAAARLNDIEAAKGWYHAYIRAGGDPKLKEDPRLRNVRL